jgi:thioredoxin 1
VVQVNVDFNARSSSEYGIRSTPSLLFFRKGKLLDRVMRALPKEEIEQHLSPIL